MAEAVHKYEHGTDSKSQKWFWEPILQADEQLIVRNDYRNARKHRDIKPVANNRRTCHLVSEPNYHTTKWFAEKLLAIEMNRNKMNRMKEK